MIIFYIIPNSILLGLKKSSLDDWVEIDSTYLDRYRYKRELFTKYPEETIQSLPGTEESCFEALYYLTEFLPLRYPSMFKKTDNGIFNLVTDDSWDLRRDSAVWKTHHPLQVMGYLTTEDWFVLQTDDDGTTTRLRAGANCFPAGWKLRERMGHSLWQIHAGKVPMYEQKLSTSMDRFFARHRADKPVTRYNYAIDISSELFHINPHHNLTLESLGRPLTIDQLYLRVERQFLQRLPKTKGLIFSIRTYVTPLLEVMKDRDIARALRTSVSSYSPQVAKYKNKHLWNDVVLKHISEILGESLDESLNT
jgi:dimethylamine monooxygenase subunit A